MCCPDGVLVRYDAASGEQPRVRTTDYHETLAELTPKFSEQVIHVPDDPATYVPRHDGPSLTLSIINEHGAEVTTPPGDLRVEKPSRKLSATVTPSARPPCLAALNRELQVQLQGIVLPANTPARAVPIPSDHFVAHGLVLLPVGWQAIEIYPRLDEEYWRPEYAAAWAQLDLLSAIAQRNAVQSALQRLDGRRAAREQYTRLLEEFEALLAGDEEPCHQFLKVHPELLCPAHDTVWSKVPFGNRVSDFVFREPCNDYLLVEIEAPHRELFRKDGHPRQELTHAMGQIDDWLGYIFVESQPFATNIIQVI
jgi:hypothetical protein